MTRPENHKGVLELSVRGRYLKVPLATLKSVPWFDTLLSGRWSEDKTIARDELGYMFINEDYDLFKAFIDHVENIRRPTPLALEMPPPYFVNERKEKEFRLMVDGYGMTESFYPLVFQKQKIVQGPSTKTPNQRVTIESIPVSLPYSLAAKKDNLPVGATLFTIAPGNKHGRHIRAFEILIEDPANIGETDAFHFGWASASKNDAYICSITKDRSNENIEIRGTYKSLQAYPERETSWDPHVTRWSNYRIQEHYPLLLRLERQKMQITSNAGSAMVFPNVGTNTPSDLRPIFYRLASNGSADVSITKIELDF